MIIKQTPWEKRNLGVDSSVELYVDSKETWNSIKDAVINRKEVYQVLHVSGGNTDVLLNATDFGFHPIETNFQLSRKSSFINLPSIYSRFLEQTAFLDANEIETNYIINQIEHGEVFRTDKIARDPRFGNEIAGRRYSFWTKDVLNQGAKLMILKYKNEVAAFDVLIDKGNGVAEAFLGGLVAKYQNSNLGLILVYQFTQYAFEYGFKKVITGVSSNNLSILKIHELLGYSVDCINYCLIKHI